MNPGALLASVGVGLHAVRHVRAVTPGGVVDDATVVVEDGTIVDISAGGAPPPGALDGHGLLLLPGLVDTHSDGLEKEIAPRSTVTFPLDFALVSFESRVRSTGITTVFHGIGFQDRAEFGRSIDLAVERCGTIADHADDPTRRLDHSILFRFEALDPAAFEPLREQLAACGPRLPGSPPIVSFEDHTPGQGQYRDLERFKAMVAAEGDRDAEEVVARRMAEAEAAAPTRAANLEAVGALARAGRIRLLAHDSDTAEAVDLAVDAGATVAEFPVSLEAARRARDHGMDIVMGAPNALRGTSHSGNVSAAELVAAGLCDALASDYMPSSLLAAAFGLAQRGVATLPQAIALVTSGPARVGGCDDRGALEPGRRADLVLVDDHGRWPRVVGVHRADDRWRSTR